MWGRGRVRPESGYTEVETAMVYKVALRHSEEGYSVSCPGLPGCWSQGATEEEALANIKDAIREYLAAAAELNRDADIREVLVSV
jgi:predicted RNase H-like HicB family nuclease